MNDRASWAAAAIARVLRPLVRLALAFGLKYPQLDAMLRQLLVDEATASWRQLRRTRINVSQLSVTTGLNRAQIKDQVTGPRAQLPATEASYASKTFTLWARLASDDRALRVIPVAASGDGVSFEKLARDATRGNVHHRAVLSELLRLRLATQHGDEVSLVSSAFVPRGDEQSLLAFLGDNTRDHLNAAVSNVVGGNPPFLERTVFSQGIAERDCIAAARTLRLGWERVHNELVHDLVQAGDRVGDAQPFRVRAGIYVYYEPWEDAGDERRAPDPDAEPHAPR